MVATYPPLNSARSEVNEPGVTTTGDPVCPFGAVITSRIESPGRSRKGANLASPTPAPVTASAFSNAPSVQYADEYANVCCAPSTFIASAHPPAHDAWYAVPAGDNQYTPSGRLHAEMAPHDAAGNAADPTVFPALSSQSVHVPAAIARMAAAVRRRTRWKSERAIFSGGWGWSRVAMRTNTAQG